MWKCEYPKEMLDGRLFMRRFRRMLPVLLLEAFLGTAVLFGIYYIKNILLGQKPFYEVKSVYMVEYVTPPVKDSDETYLDAGDWNRWIHSDEFLETVEAKLSWAKGREALIQSLEVTFPEKEKMDYRVPTVTVMAETPEEAMEMMEAVNACLLEGLESMDVEITESTSAQADPMDSVRMVAAARRMDVDKEAVMVTADVRPLRALLLSAVVSCFSMGIVFAVKETGSQCIRAPETLRKRYGIPVLGMVRITGKKEDSLLKENLRYFLDQEVPAAVLLADKGEKGREVFQKLADEMDITWTVWKEGGEQQKSHGVIVAVEAGRKNDEAIRRALETVKKAGIEKAAFLLYGSDRDIL